MTDLFIAAATVSEVLSFGDKGFGDELFWGAARTLQIAVFAYVIGLAIGIVGAMGKLYGSPWTKKIISAYTTLVRAVPELVLILLLYYVGTEALNSVLGVYGFGPFEINGLAAAIGVLAFVQGAYSTEVMRAAITAVPIGQIEAGKAYGLTGRKMLHRIILPAMLPNAIPGLSNLWLNCTKDTALISVVGFTELALATRQAAGSTKMYFTFYFAALLLYWLISEISGLLFAWAERRARRGQPKLT
jgi:polar amino acid transport system permease protein